MVREQTEEKCWDCVSGLGVCEEKEQLGCQTGGGVRAGLRACMEGRMAARS